jgi:hypothetical protein
MPDERYAAARAFLAAASHELAQALARLRKAVSDHP